MKARRPKTNTGTRVDKDLMDIRSHIHEMNRKDAAAVAEWRAFLRARLDLESLNLIESVISMSDRCTVEMDSPERCVYLNESKGASIDLGKKIWARGGTDLMHAAMQCIPKPDRPELSLVWDGIGEWRS